MGYEDLLDEIRFALEAYESNQKKAPETKKVTDESNVIEGETRVIPDNQQKLLEGPVGRLQDDQVAELEEFYGVDKNNPEFWKRLQEDVITFAEKGAKAVKQAIREIIRQVHAGVLAVGIVFNPGGITAPEAFILHNPVEVTTTQEVKAEVPKAVASKMSDGAKEAYEILIPAMKGKNGDKLMVFVDKPTGRIFIFDAEGKPILDKKVLIGLAKGDLYKGNNDLPQNRITPAGLFGIKLVDAAKGGSAKKTAGEYDFGKVFALEDPDAVVTIMHSVWLKEKDAAQRQAALQSESAAMTPFLATSSPAFLAAAAATGLDSFFKSSFSIPVPPATKPIPVPAMMLSQFLPVKFWASNAILETSSLERSGYCLATSSLTAS